MRTAIIVGVVLAGVASVAAQDYQSPVPPLPTTVKNPIDASPATQPATAIPAAQTLGANVQTPPAQMNTQQH
jgi:hypothetical protein